MRGVHGGRMLHTQTPGQLSAMHYLSTHGDVRGGTNERGTLLRQLAASETSTGSIHRGDEYGDGTESPAIVDGREPRPVVRSFAFIDLCNSTEYFEAHGSRAALQAISRFRSIVRDVCAVRGIRVAKWIGDGAMLVSIHSGPIIAGVVDISQRMWGEEVVARGGVSVSIALPFDGDDYIARGANFAARLCDLAGAGEILCDDDCRADIPDWVNVVEQRDEHVRGMGVHTLHVLDGTRG